MKPERIAQPFDEAAGDEHRAFERVSPFAAELVQHRAEQAVLPNAASPRPGWRARTRRCRKSPWCRRGARQPWPIVAACWSPARPQIGIAAPNSVVEPNRPALSVTSGSAPTRHAEQLAQALVPARAASSGSSRVRLALPASGQVRAGQLEGQPALDRAEGQPPGSAPRRPRRARCRAASASWWPRSRDRAAGRSARVPRSSCPASRSAAQKSAVRRSCQTSARASGSPVCRSQATTVSRWLAMPIAAIRSAPPARSTMSRAQASVLSQISPASCSTQPGRG